MTCLLLWLTPLQLFITNEQQHTAASACCCCSSLPRCSGHATSPPMTSQLVAHVSHAPAAHASASDCTHTPHAASTPPSHAGSCPQSLHTPVKVGLSLVYYNLASNWHRWPRHASGLPLGLAGNAAPRSCAVTCDVQCCMHAAAPGPRLPLAHGARGCMQPGSSGRTMQR